MGKVIVPDQATYELLVTPAMIAALTIGLYFDRIFFDGSRLGLFVAIILLSIIYGSLLSVAYRKQWGAIKRFHNSKLVEVYMSYSRRDKALYNVTYFGSLALLATSSFFVGASDITLPSYFAEVYVVVFPTLYAGFQFVHVYLHNKRVIAARTKSQR